MKLEKGQTLEDFQQGVTLSFHQDRACGQAFLDLFGAKMPNCLFPREIIAQIGTKIWKGNMVTQTAIDAYCEAHGASPEAVAQILKNYGVSTCKKTAFYPSPRQSDGEYEELFHYWDDCIRSHHITDYLTQRDDLVPNQVLAELYISEKVWVNDDQIFYTAETLRPNCLSIHCGDPVHQPAGDAVVIVGENGGLLRHTLGGGQVVENMELVIINSCQYEEKYRQEFNVDTTENPDRAREA